jgi:hypothetical protein
MDVNENIHLHLHVKSIYICAPMISISKTIGTTLVEKLVVMLDQGMFEEHFVQSRKGGVNLIFN